MYFFFFFCQMRGKFPFAEVYIDFRFVVSDYTRIRMELARQICSERQVVLLNSV